MESIGSHDQTGRQTRFQEATEKRRARDQLKQQQERERAKKMFAPRKLVGPHDILVNSNLPKIKLEEHVGNSSSVKNEPVNIASSLADVPADIFVNSSTSTGNQEVDDKYIVRLEEISDFEEPTVVEQLAEHIDQIEDNENSGMDCETYNEQSVLQKELNTTDNLDEAILRPESDEYLQGHVNLVKELINHKDKVIKLFSELLKQIRPQFNALNKILENTNSEMNRNDVGSYTFQHDNDTQSTAITGTDEQIAVQLTETLVEKDSMIQLLTVQMTTLQNDLLETVKESFRVDKETITTKQKDGEVYNETENNTSEVLNETSAMNANDNKFLQVHIKSLRSLADQKDKETNQLNNMVKHLREHLTELDIEAVNEHPNDSNYPDATELFKRKVVTRWTSKICSKNIDIEMLTVNLIKLQNNLLVKMDKPSKICTRCKDSQQVERETFKMVLPFLFYKLEAGDIMICRKVCRNWCEEIDIYLKNNLDMMQVEKETNPNQLTQLEFRINTDQNEEPLNEPGKNYSLPDQRLVDNLADANMVCRSSPAIENELPTGSKEKECIVKLPSPEAIALANRIRKRHRNCKNIRLGKLRDRVNEDYKQLEREIDALGAEIATEIKLQDLGSWDFTQCKMKGCFYEQRPLKKHYIYAHYQRSHSKRNEIKDTIWPSWICCIFCYNDTEGFNRKVAANSSDKHKKRILLNHYKRCHPLSTFVALYDQSTPNDVHMENDVLDLVENSTEIS